MVKKTPPDTGQRDGFLDALADQFLAGMDKEGLRSKLAEVLAKDAASHITVERLAAEIQSRQGEEFAGKLTKAAVDKLLEEWLGGVRH